jgi:TatD DNase family protein
MPNVQLIDTHAHLHLAHFDNDRIDAIARAAAAGVSRIIEIGYDVPSSRAALALAEEYPQIYAVVGIQPNHVAGLGDEALDEVRRLAAHPKAVAIGEIGLDYYHQRAAPELQERWFREQLALARELALPVVIHSRDAQADTIRILRDAARGQPGIMHSFSGDWAYAEACLEIGFYLSFSGPVTFAKATTLHEAARRAPLDHILTETDSPYLTPNPYRGKRNEPTYVCFVAERLATLREMPLEELTVAVWRNAEAVFNLPKNS